MEEEAKTKAKPPRGSAKALLTVESAEDKILSKLAKVGTKGAAAPHAKPKAGSLDVTMYAQALAALEDEQRREIFVDRRGKKPKYFLWKDRPALPNAESVAQKVRDFARGKHPVIYHEVGFGKGAGLTKDEKPWLSAALRLLCDSGEFTALQFALTAKSRHQLYAVTEAFASREVTQEAPTLPQKESPPTRSNTFSLEDLKPAYEDLVRRVGFPAVPIASLQRQAAVPMEALKDLLRRERDAGRVALSVGDWSIASEEERRGVIEMHGRQYLQVRWLS